MKNRTFRTRVLAAALGTTLLPAFAVAGITFGAPAVAQAKVEKAGCKVHGIYATKKGTGKVPNNLGFLKAELEGDDFAAFKSFELLETKKLKLKLKAAKTANMKSGHKVRLSLLGGDDRRLELHTTLVARKGNKALVDMNYTIDQGGVLFIGGVSFKDGRMFFAIQCAS